MQESSLKLAAVRWKYYNGIKNNASLPISCSSISSACFSQTNFYAVWHLFEVNARKYIKMAAKGLKYSAEMRRSWCYKASQKMKIAYRLWKIRNRYVNAKKTFLNFLNIFLPVFAVVIIEPYIPICKYTYHFCIEFHFLSAGVTISMSTTVPHAQLTLLPP